MMKTLVVPLMFYTARWIHVLRSQSADARYIMRKLVAGGAAGVALLVLIAIGAAMLIDVDQFRPTLEREFERAAGRRVSLGRIRLAALAGNVSVENVSIDEDPTFGATPFVTAKAVKVAVEFWPLIVSRRLHVQAFTLEEPHIVLRRSPSGTWNFSTIGAASAATPTPPASATTRAVPGLAIGKLVISDGRITVAQPGPRARERVYTGVNIQATDLSYSSRFPFRLDAMTPGSGSVHMQGTAGPLDSNDLSATPVDANVQVKQFDVAASGFVDPASGLGGIIDFSGTVTSNGREAISKGSLSANRLQLVQGSPPARVPVTIDYRSAYDLRRRSGTIEQGDVRIGRALARLSGGFRTDADATSVRMKIAGHQMPVPELEAALPAIGVTLPAGASLEGGTLDLDLDVNGPIDRLTTTGPIKMSNTRLKGFDLGAEMAVVAAFAGIPRSADTAIETLSAKVRVSPGGIRAEALQLVVPAIGRLGGTGTIGPQGALDFRMLAQLTSSSGIARDVARITSFGGPGAGTPFLVTGTTSAPLFAPDVSGVVRGMVNQDTATKAASGLLKGLFNKKPK